MRFILGLLKGHHTELKVFGKSILHEGAFNNSG
jgi:hypothetical protein